MAIEALRSAIDKLDGAETQLSALRRASQEGAVTELLSWRIDRDEQGWVRARVHELREPPPEWFVWIGECLYNMRSALDHIAFALNARGSEQSSPPNHRASQFPLFVQEADFQNMCRGPAKECMVGYFCIEARAVVERLQPYHDDDDDALRLNELRVLSNIDKHRRVPVTVSTNSVIVSPSEIEGHRVTSTDTDFGPMAPGSIIARFEVPALPTDVQEPNAEGFGVGLEFEFEGQAADPPVPIVMPHEPVWFVLSEIHQTIRSRVLPDFERFFR
jgi:hypothetical protein